MNEIDIKIKLESFERGSKELIEYIAHLIDNSTNEEWPVLKSVLSGYKSELKSSTKVKSTVTTEDFIEKVKADVKHIKDKITNGESITELDEKAIEIYTETFETLKDNK